ncbi:MAG: hypothetical protein DDT22_01368 [candidate division WS2 bacterium]|nr:hypothetical protein [Candidatus Lithacetigena glycinireducens]
MSKYYTLEEVKAIRDEISQLGERTFPQLEAEWNRTREEWKKVRVGWGKVMVEWDKTTGWKKTMAEWKEAEARYNKARDELYKAMAGWDVKLFRILFSICPEAYYIEWRGYLAIPKSEDEEWIIPVFAGDFNGVKHTAFSIWEMPKGSCDEGDAKEVKDA